MEREEEASVERVGEGGYGGCLRQAAQLVPV